MLNESQRAALRLRAARDQAEALVQELMRARREAEGIIRQTGEHPDDLRIDISRQAMRRALDDARRRLKRLNAALDRVERGEVDPAQIDPDAPEGSWPGEDDGLDRGPDAGEGPQIP